MSFNNYKKHIYPLQSITVHLGATLNLIHLNTKVGFTHFIHIISWNKLLQTMNSKTLTKQTLDNQNEYSVY